MKDIFDYTYAEEIDVDIMITYACNFSCSYCIASEINNTEKSGEDTYLNVDKMEDIIRFLSFISSRKFTINIIGGEPLINIPRLLTFLSLLNNTTDLPHLKEIKIITNAFFIDKKSSQAFKELLKTFKYKLYIKASIDGDPLLSDNRGTIFMNKLIVNKIRLLQETIGSEYLILSMVVSQESIKYFFHNFSFLLSLSPYAIEYALAKGQDFTKENINLLKKEYLKLIKWYIRNGSSTRFDLGDLESTSNNIPCSKGLAHFIDYKGYIYPCYSFLKKAHVKNDVFKYTIDKILDKNQYLELLEWGKKYFFTKYLDSDERIAYAHCFSGNISRENINDFETFRKLVNIQLREKLTKSIYKN